MKNFSITPILTIIALWLLIVFNIDIFLSCIHHEPFDVLKTVGDKLISAVSLNISFIVLFLSVHQSDSKNSNSFKKSQKEDNDDIY
jgi:hypothetical protein